MLIQLGLLPVRKPAVQESQPVPPIRKTTMSSSRATPSDHPLTLEEPASATKRPPKKSYDKFKRAEIVNGFKDELNVVNGTKVICSLDQILELFVGHQCKCCTKPVSVRKHMVQGCTLVVFLSVPKAKKESGALHIMFMVFGQTTCNWLQPFSFRETTSKK